MQLSRNILMGLLCVPTANALTIIEVSGPNDESTVTIIGFLANGPALGFSLASDYTNVAISVSLASFSDAGGDVDWNLDAFLTTQLGSGTNAQDHEIAMAQVITVPGTYPFSPPFTITPFTVFSGLALSAGDYYYTGRPPRERERVSDRILHFGYQCSHARWGVCDCSIPICWFAGSVPAREFLHR